MGDERPRCFVIRHGETEWSRSGRHTGRTDLPLLPEGADQARALRAPMAEQAFAAVFTSPLLRARQTGELAGWGDVAVVDPDLAEWDYGGYEGWTTAAIREERPGWVLFDDGAPGGEAADDVGTRVDRVIERVRSVDGDVACFAHSHVLRVLVARWTGLDPVSGRVFTLDPASVSILGWEREQPVVAQLNRPPW